MTGNENTNPNQGARTNSAGDVNMLAKDPDAGLEDRGRIGGDNAETVWIGSGAWSNAPRGTMLIPVQIGDQGQGQQAQNSSLVRESQQARVQKYLEDVRTARRKPEEIQQGQQHAGRGDAQGAQSGQHVQQGQQAHANQQAGLQYGQQQIEDFQRYQQAQRAQLQQQLAQSPSLIPQLQPPQPHGHSGGTWNLQPEKLLSKTQAQRPQVQAQYLFHESQQPSRSQPSSASRKPKSGSRPSSMSQLTPQQQQPGANNEMSSFQRMGMSPSEQAQLHRQYQQAQQSLRGSPSSGSRGALRQRFQQAQQQAASPLSQAAQQQEHVFANSSFASKSAQIEHQQAQLQSQSNAAAVSQLPSQQFELKMGFQLTQNNLQQAQLQSGSNAAVVSQRPLQQFEPSMDFQLTQKHCQQAQLQSGLDDASTPPDSGLQTRPGSASNLQSMTKQQQNTEQRLQNPQQQPKAMESPVSQSQEELNGSQIPNALVQAQRNSFSQPGQPLQQQQQQAQGMRAQTTKGQYPAGFFVAPQVKRPGQPTQSTSFSGILHQSQTQPQRAHRANQHHTSGNSPSPARQQQQAHRFDPRFSQPGIFSNGSSPQVSGLNFHSANFFGGQDMRRGGFQQHQEEPPSSFFSPPQNFASYRDPDRLPLTKEEYRETELALEAAQDALYAVKLRKQQLAQMLQDQEKAFNCKAKEVETYLEQEKKNKKRKKEEYHMLQDIYEFTSKLSEGGYEYGIDAGLGDEFGMGSDGEMSAPDERDDHQGARSAPYMHFGINTEAAGIRVPEEEEAMDGNMPVNMLLANVAGGRRRGGRKSGTPGRGPGRPRVRSARLVRGRATDIGNVP